ncbi:MAG: dipeptidase [Candidatus Omnitrophica bacterium]|nr:dipeptidase [Candidatus Omnitrophota bacterium]
MHYDALTYTQQHRRENLEDLQALLRIPSISTLPESKPDLQRTAQWLADKLNGLGLDHVQIMPTAGHPVVYADWLDAGPAAPTLLIYGHYDVQPIDPLDEWLTPPFEPTVKGDNMFGRGATDDKGQLYVHIAAVEAYLKGAGQLPLNIKFMLEGEEEIGSPNLSAFMRANLDLLKADAALISDSHILDPHTPVLITGVRGLAYLEVTLRGSTHDLHSGSYGGVVQNPLNALVRLLASLHDEQGRVTIPGFYDDVRDLSPAERAAMNSGLITDESVLAETGAPALWGEAGYTAAERKSVRPTLDIHGIRGGFVGAGQKTVIPAVASAKVSMRLVPNQSADKTARLFIDHIQRIAPKTMGVSIEKMSCEDGAVVDISTPAIEAAAEAYEQGFGRRPYYMREGGSIPVVSLLDKLLSMPVVMMGFGLPDDRLHAPNEKFHLPNFYRGIETAIHYYNIFSRKGN